MNSRELTIEVLSQESVLESGIFELETVLPAIKNAILQKAKGEVAEPAPATLAIDPDRGQRLVAHASLLRGKTSAAGVKWIGANPQNPASEQMPRASAVMLISDPISGRLEALVEGTVISFVRTAAVVALAAKVFANPESASLLLIGAGVSNRAALAMLRQLFPKLSRVEVYDLDLAKAQAWAEEESTAETKVTVCAELNSAITEADLIVTATADKVKPYLAAEATKPGVFVGAISMNDVFADSVPSFDRLITTDFASLTYSYSAIASAISEGLLESDRVELIQDSLSPEDKSQFFPNQRVLFEVWGLGLFDLALASEVLRKARLKGSTNRVSLWNEPFWW